MPIEWDSTKSAANLKKHGVSFGDAANLLASDVDYFEIYDERHSEDEDRFIAIGPSSHGVIVVVYTESDDNSVRIISARVATKAERGRYEEHEQARRCR